MQAYKQIIASKYTPYASNWLLLALSFIALLLTYQKYTSKIFDSWQREEYSHGVLIPFIAVLMGLHILSEKKPLLTRSWLGLPLILTGYLLIALAELSAFEPPAHYGFLVGLTGVLLAFCGCSAVVKLAPSLIYLAFAIPLPRLIEVALTAKLQLISSSFGVVILQLLGVPVFQDGNIIDLGTEKLQVVEACSGLRYLFPLMSFSFLLAMMFRGAVWKRVVIFMSAIPITLIMNAFRIAIIGLLVDRWGSNMAQGLIHDIEGWGVFIICILVLLIEVWLLSHIGQKKDALRLHYVGIPVKPFFTGSPSQSRAGIIALALCIGASSILWGLNLGNRKEITPVRTPLIGFPLTIGEWQGRQDYLPSNILETLKLTDYWSANYSRGNEPPVNLYIAYYQSQRMGVAAHSPANCVPAGGWVVEEKSIAPIELEHMTLPVTRMLIRKDNVSMLVYYWFDQRGRIINEQFSAKWYLLVDSITRHRTDGAIVRLIVQAVEQQDIKAADEQVRQFLDESYPVIQSYIPR